jgi:hypothetical protein
MKMTKLLTTAMILGTITFSTGLILAGNVSARGPIPMASFDTNGDGSITEQELNDARAKHQEKMKASGRRGAGMVSAPSFAAIDTDKDGKLSVEEIKTMQAKQQANRGKGKSKGNGKGNGKGSGNGGNRN